MTFAPSFGRIFSPTFQPNSQSSAVSWWLSGGIASANCIAAYQPKGAADLASSYVNLANPGTYNAAPGVAPTFNTSTGWEFNGLTQYLSTGFFAPAGQTGSFAIKFIAPTQVGSVFGANTHLQHRFGIYFFGGLIGFENWGLLEVTQAYLSTTVIVAGSKAYIDGVYKGEILTQAGIPSQNILIGCRSYPSGGIPNFFSNAKVSALAVYSSNIAAQVSSLNTAMAAL